MHVLFLHQEFPAQFGALANRLAAVPGNRVTFLSRQPAARVGGVEKIQYNPRSGATQATHYASRTFENVVWHSDAVFAALKARPDVVPDLVVAHAGFLSALPLRELYRCPVVNYFEYFYHVVGTDLDFRPEFPPSDEDRIRARFRNAHLLLDLHNCDLGYSPTRWQRDRLPPEYRDKVRVLFDGVDCKLWRRSVNVPRRAGRFHFPDDVKLVTYVARGLESIRGFDVFMRLAKVLYSRRSDVRFVVVGADRVCYGGDLARTGGRSFKQWVLAQDDYDLKKIAFLGTVPADVLAQLFSITDLHVYLTAPFVLSWSLMNALACGAVVLASRTPPVMEMIEHGRNGLLADFFDVEGLADAAEAVLDDPAGHRPLGDAGIEFVRSRYSTEVCLPPIERLFHEALQASSTFP